jgi:hypothetical protein
METPVLLKQYSARLIDGIALLTEAMLTIDRACAGALSANQRRAQHVLALGNLDARIVDEYLESAEGGEGAIDNRAMLTEIGDVAVHESASATALTDPR